MIPKESTGMGYHQNPDLIRRDFSQSSSQVRRFWCAQPPKKQQALCGVYDYCRVITDEVKPKSPYCSLLWHRSLLRLANGNIINSQLRAPAMRARGAMPSPDAPRGRYSHLPAKLNRFRVQGAGSIRTLPKNNTGLKGDYNPKPYILST